jgi:hypothetical protein
LLPAHGAAVTLAAEEAKALAGEEETRMIGVKAEVFLLREGRAGNQ